MEKITFIKRDDTDREGNALVSAKTGRPYTRLTLKVESKGDRYLSGFESAQTKDWVVGDEIDITITESDKKDKTGKPYLNFSLPKKMGIGDVTSPDLTEMRADFNKMLIIQGSMRNDIRIVIDLLRGPKKGVPPLDYPQQSNVTSFDEPEEEQPF